MDYVDFGKIEKNFFLFDTFQGIPDLFARDYQTTYRDSYQEVVETFKKFPNVRLIKGEVPDTLPLADIKSVTFLSIDMNAAEPERAAFEYFWDKLVSGAIVVLDDYG